MIAGGIHCGIGETKQGSDTMECQRCGKELDTTHILYGEVECPNCGFINWLEWDDTDYVARLPRDLRVELDDLRSMREVYPF